MVSYSVKRGEQERRANATVDNYAASRTLAFYQGHSQRACGRYDEQRRCAEFSAPAMARLDQE